MMNILNINMKDELSKMEERELAYLQMAAPQWMTEDNDLLINQLLTLGELYSKGKIVWGAIVQANTMLFSNDVAYSCPATVIYDPVGRASLEQLHDAAYKLFELKNTEPDDPESAEYAEYISDERKRDLINVPSIVSEYPLKTKTMFIWRPHLPDGVLRFSHFPILLLNDEITLLPARFWQNSEFYREWVAESDIDMSSAFYSLNINDNIWGKYQSHFYPKREELDNFAENPIPYRRAKVSPQALSFMAECKSKVIESSFAQQSQVSEAAEKGTNKEGFILRHRKCIGTLLVLYFLGKFMSYLLNR